MNTQKTTRPACPRLALLSALTLIALSASADPDRAANCAACHATPRNGMYLSNYQSYTNLGSGLRGLFKVTAGQTLGINWAITNTYGADYGLTVNNLTTTAGVSNGTHHLTFTPDPTWDNRTTYFTVGPTATAQAWTFNLAISSNTPPDFYAVQTQMPGVSSGRWSQQEWFYIQVLAPVPTLPPAPTLVGLQKSGNSFSCRAATINGFTYYLEYRTLIATGSWANAAQVIGNGSIKTLTDTSAGDAQRFYRVRVQ